METSIRTCWTTRSRGRRATPGAKRSFIPKTCRGRWRGAEECLYVVEGHGYDLHQDCNVEISDTYRWQPQAEIKRFEWEAGDVIYIPPCTIHSALQRGCGAPGAVDLVHQPHLQELRLERSRANRGCAGIRSNIVLTAELVRDYLAARASEPA